MTRAINLITNIRHQEIQAETHKNLKRISTPMSNSNVRIPYSYETQYDTDI
jgi:hypothetical protein